MSVTLQWIICLILGAAAAAYLALAWGLLPSRRPNKACHCTKCPLAESTVSQLSQLPADPRRRQA